MSSGLERRYDVDWLRFLAICAVFLFHCARFFDEQDWHVKNAQTDFGMTVFVIVFAQWIMPIFFILSGISTYYGLGAKQQNGPYLWERFKRLMIPLIFGVFAMIPFQVYYERVSHGQFAGSFFDFFPRYFDGFYAFGGNFAWMGLHLWYLLFLFIFTLLTLPLFAFLKKPCGQRLIAGVADLLAKPGAILLIFIAVTVLDFALLPNSIMGTRDMGGWNLFTYLLLYIYGYIIAGDTRFRETIQADRRAALLLGLISLAILYYWSVNIGRSPAGYNTGHMVFTAVRCLNSWCFLIAILGYGSKYLTFNNNLLKYTSRLILPFYILHQTVIVTIGFYVVQWDAGITLKYLVISTSSLVVIMLLYEILIKRVSLLSFLFGMKSKKA